MESYNLCLEGRRWGFGLQEECGQRATVKCTFSAVVGEVATVTAKSGDEDDEEVNFLDIQKNLKSYSQKELRALANVTKLNEELREASRENSMLKDKLKNCMDSESRGKRDYSEIQLEPKNELNKVKLNLIAQLMKNEKLERDLNKVKIDLEKSLR
ncbi:hypothetical protein HAX54_028921 [Datura stramonium]|uniref:LAMB1/2/3/4 helical domain-containing protein n=1 Tax=Datura stramonium TaxID=4076 RepID=A0ABS8V4Z6_DATST|nr:hypothetical protein [Datura stramonium]